MQYAGYYMISSQLEPLKLLNVLICHLSTLEATGHVAAHGALHHSLVLLAARDRVVSEGVLLALRAGVVRGPRHEGRADAVPGLLVTRRRRRTVALLALREPEVLKIILLPSSSCESECYK